MVETAYPQGSESQGYALTKKVFGHTLVPAVSTQVVTGEVTIQQVSVSNVTGAAATLTLTDGSTEIGGTTPATIWTKSVAANDSQVFLLNGMVAKAGIKWLSGTANALHAQLVYNIEA